MTEKTNGIQQRNVMATGLPASDRHLPATEHKTATIKKIRWLSDWGISTLVFASYLAGASAQSQFDLVADFSDSQNPNGVWSFGWMPPETNVFNPYGTSFAAFGLNLDEWRGPFLDDNGSAPPNVICNPTDTPITVSDTTWMPHQVTFHPGQNGERSVVRWTSPMAGTADLVTAFEGRSGFVTSHVEIYQNSVLLFSGMVLGTGAASQISFATNLAFHVGDRIDFRVDYGNGDWASDTTQVSIVITAMSDPAVSISLLTPFSAQLTWPTNTASYLLESAAQLPATLWLPVTNQPSVQGDHFALTVGTTNQGQFFRLRGR